jgi:hypothetical protein
MPNFSAANPHELGGVVPGWPASIAVAALSGAT